MRLRRSLMWVYGHDLTNLPAVLASDVDCVVFDLEDGVRIPDKPAARRNVLAALKDSDFRRKERVVRVNGLDTDFVDDDIRIVLSAAPDAVRLPKCESVEYVLKLDRILTDLESQHGLPDGSIEIILMIETALGVMRCYEMATCSKRVTAMGVGMEDLAASMGVPRRYELNSTDLLYARQRMVLEAKAAGVQALDSGLLFRGDADYVYQDSVADANQGFDGRSLSDLSHVEAINRAFSPSGKDLEWAKRVFAYCGCALEEGQLTAEVDERYLESPVVVRALGILDKLRLIRQRQAVE